MTRDRSYTTHEEYIFQMCGVESWTELWEQAPGIELMQALMAEGLVSVNALIKKMVMERVGPAENKSAEIRNIAIELKLSKNTVRNYAYKLVEK